jgi:inositol oxygenase
MTPKDEQYMEWIKDFNQYDLYTKSPVVPNYEELKHYYMPIAEKYLGKGPIYW